MDIFDWIRQTLTPEARTSEDLIYEHMESQSGRSLPLIYQPFNVDDRGHWADRGAALDFIAATGASGGRVLDFGPGDGWPSLIIAPQVGEVIGVDGSPRRVAVCAQNAARLGITNAHFRHVEPGSPLPFDAESFDAVVAASSVEQSPDPHAVLTEFHRVLRPGGRLRLSYEALGRYRGGEERDLALWEEQGRTYMVLFDRRIREEEALQIRLTLDLPRAVVMDHFTAGSGRPRFEDVTVERLAVLRQNIMDAAQCITTHPSGTTLARWLAEIGFREVSPTHNGVNLARGLYDRVAPDARPQTLESLDAYLGPIVDVVIGLPAPLAVDPWITAVKKPTASRRYVRP